MGKSKQEAQAERYGGALNDLRNSISGTDFGVDNRFDNYQPQFNYDTMKASLDNIYKNAGEDIIRNKTEDINKIQSGTAERLASQGITGGSIANEAINNSGNEIRKRAFDATRKLGESKAGQNIGLQQYANNLGLDTTKLASDVDFENMMNLFRKYNLLGSNLGQIGESVKMYDNTTPFDDVLAVANTVAQFIPGNGGGAGKAG